MIALMALLQSMFATPEAQRDPYAWSATLLAHAWLGLGGALAAMTVVPGLWGSFAATAAYGLLWEARQYRRGLGWDCILDTVAWALGAVLAAQIAPAGWPSAAFAWLAVLLIAAAGVCARSRGR